MSAPVITLHELEKRYGAVRALDRVTAEIPSGPVGLLGPNGAGKSTLLKLLLGLLAPDRGSARIAGFDPSRRADRLALRRVVGYMPESDCLIPRMNGVELVQTLARVTGLSKKDAMTRAHEVLDYVGLEEARYRGLDEYSTGMKQRLKLAQALVHDPRILLLDEPTNGLDPKGRRHMLALVHDLGHAQEKNVLFCSHLLPDVESTCESVVVIDRGRVLETGTIADLTRHDDAWLRAEIDGAGEPFRRGLAEAGVTFEEEGERRFRVRLPPSEGDRLFAVASAARVALTALVPLRSSLEDVFLATLRDAESRR